MRVAIHQPNYLPWGGYFAKAAACDTFVFLNDVQPPGGTSYLYRTAVALDGKAHWLSVPTSRSTHERVQDVRFADSRWARKHLMTLRSIYGRAPEFAQIFSLLQPRYEDPGESLAGFNACLVRTIAQYLGISCRFISSSELEAEGEADDRLLCICKRVGASTYISGRGGQKYQNPEKFADAGVELRILSYAPIPYRQLGCTEFVPGLSIVDALFNLGGATRQLLAQAERDAAVL